jgi:hypothetical protein
MFRSALSAPAGRIGDSVHRTMFLRRVRNGFSINGLRLNAERLGVGTTLIRRTNMASALNEKLKEAIVGELKRQAADRPQTLSVSDSPDLFVNGKIDLDALIMVVAGSVAGGP